MKKLILLSLLIISLDYSFAQKQGPEKFDSLKSVIGNSIEDTGKVRMLAKLSFNYYRYDTDSGIIYGEKALVLSEKLKWGLGVAVSCNGIATNYAVKGNYPKALEYFNKSFSKYTEIGDKVGIAHTSNNLGNLYSIQKEYPKAIEFFNNAIIINKEINNKINLATNYNNIGKVYSEMSDFSKSNEYYYEALKIDREIGNKELITQCLNNIAENKMKINDYCGALELCIESIKICEEIKSAYDLAVSNRLAGEIYLRISSDSINVNNKCKYYSNDKQENLFKAKIYLYKAIDLLNKINDLSLLSETCLNLSRVYEKLGDTKNALSYYKKYSANKDSVFSKDNSIKIANIEKKQEVELRDKQIIIQTLEIEKKNSQIVNQIVIFVLILLLIAFIFYIYFKIQKRQKAIKAEIERKKAEAVLRESEEKFRAIANYSASWESWFSQEGKLLWMNPYSIDLTGYTPEEYISAEDYLSMVIAEEDKVIFLEKFKEALQGSSGDNLEIRNLRKDGSKFWVSVSWRPILDSTGRSLGFRTSTRDITERKLAEEELIIAKEKAEESERLKSAFLANMSHEIRTPMNGILGFAQLLKEPNLTNEEQQRFINIIEVSGIRMLNIINDIVDISKIESGQMKVSISDININEQIEYLYTFFKPEVEVKGIQFSFKNSLPSRESIIKTDREKIYAILVNLVKNAIKYTNKGSIEFGYEKKGKFLEFFVKDTGIGIAEDRQKAIFDRFIQEDILDKGALQGAGLGLTIAKAYAEMLGGKIWVESEKGKGSIFYFSIPYNSGQEEETVDNNFVSKDKEANRIKSLRILIAEDDEPSEILMAMALKIFGKEVLKVRTGIDAVEACRNNPDIDLVLMDIKMPQMDGYEATRQIRQFNKDVIIIAQTAYGLYGDREKAMEAGCNDYISKPLNITRLIELIRRHVKK